MAESSFAWISVVVKRGSSTILPRKIVKIGWDSNFGELLAVVDPTLANDTINKVCISGKDSFLDPVHELDVTAPLSPQVLLRELTDEKLYTCGSALFTVL